MCIYIVFCLMFSLWYSNVAVLVQYLSFFNFRTIRFIDFIDLVVVVSCLFHVLILYYVFCLIFK